jgi:RNA polymerase sigma-70 factor (ECF subfamily)
MQAVQPTATAGDPTGDERAADDRARVAAVLADAPGAFEQLVRDHQGLCWHVVQRMVRHPEDTRELCQETFLRVHRHLHQYRFDAPLKSWIAQVAYSVAKRHLERRRIPLAEAVDGDGMSLAEAVGDGHDVEAAVAGDQAGRRLHAAIESLPPLQRTLLTLYHLEELPIPEVSRITGIAEGTIKSHLFRSRRQLRALLETDIGDLA